MILKRKRLYALKSLPEHHAKLIMHFIRIGKKWVNQAIVPRRRSTFCFTFVQFEVITASRRCAFFSGRRLCLRRCGRMRGSILASTLFLLPSLRWAFRAGYCWFPILVWDRTCIGGTRCTWALLAVVLDRAGGCLRKLRFLTFSTTFLHGTMNWSHDSLEYTLKHEERKNNHIWVGRDLTGVIQRMLTANTWLFYSLLIQIWCPNLMGVIMRSKTTSYIGHEREQ